MRSVLSHQSDTLSSPQSAFVEGHFFCCYLRRLKEHLRQKLIESGWRDDLKKYTMGAPTSLDMRSYHHAPHTACFLLHSILLSCDSLIFRTASAELIRSKGDTTMTVEQLTAEIIPRGRGACPPNWPRFAP